VVVVFATLIPVAVVVRKLLSLSLQFLMFVAALPDWQSICSST